MSSTFSRQGLLLTLLVIGFPHSAFAQTYCWQQPQSTVLPTGDLQWAPQPFKYVAGATVRYIDFVAGNDNNTGATKAQAWQHHPWDPTAGGEAKKYSGPTTYVFKRGVAYRGVLRPTESGTAAEPIRLTSDPSWGEGETGLYGSEIVAGWQQGGPDSMPEKEKVWYADLTFTPRYAWMVSANGEATRLKLARTPNWTVKNPDDVAGEWWAWENPGWWQNPNPWKTKIGNTTMHLGCDTKHITQPEDYYKGALVWSEWGVVMGAPYPTRVEGVDTMKKALAFQGPWYNDSQSIHTNNRYYLEDKPQFLDEAGEFWFDKQGNGGRLYVRLPGDVDPHTVTVEAAKNMNCLDSKGMSHLQVSGLTFRFWNVYWDITNQVWQNPDVNNAAIRILGAADDIVIKNCKFDETPKAVRLEAYGVMDHIVVADNDIRFADHGAIEIVRAGNGTLGDVQVLRNRLFDIGARAVRPNGQMALQVGFPTTAEIAGNLIDRCYASGLFIFGAKGSGDTSDRPFSRILIHHNKVTNSLLAANDWGGIETWQGGPYYVYDNISGNPRGPMNWGGHTFGHAFYLDGAFKNYHFNNIAWGDNSDPKSKFGNTAAFQEIISYQNTFFNNTVYKFINASRRQAADAGRDKFLGNVFQDIGNVVFRHSDAEGKDPNARDAGQQGARFAYELNAYGSNVFNDIRGAIGAFEAPGGDYKTVDTFAAALAKEHALRSDAGVMTATAPLRDPAHFDFRLTTDSAARHLGVKVFVPWSIYATVGEWNFSRNVADPAAVIDEHWYMTSYFHNRDDYYKRPTYPLTALNVTAKDYLKGVLEDWTEGALNFDGRQTYCSLSDTVASKRVCTNVDMPANNFLIEAVFKTEKGHKDGVLVSKYSSSGNGYKLDFDQNGKARLSLMVSGKAAYSVSGAAIVNDGKWHHLIAEVDRSGKTNIYVDGVLSNGSSTGAMPSSTVSLGNTADLLVGKSPDGNYFKGTLDFLRLSKGTLSDARTSIGELYKWELDGPFLRDFTGKIPVGKKRDVGAVAAQ